MSLPQLITSQILGILGTANDKDIIANLVIAKLVEANGHMYDIYIDHVSISKIFERNGDPVEHEGDISPELKHLVDRVAIIWLRLFQFCRYDLDKLNVAISTFICERAHNPDRDYVAALNDLYRKYQMSNRNELVVFAEDHMYVDCLKLLRTPSERPLPVSDPIDVDEECEGDGACMDSLKTCNG